MSKRQKILSRFNLITSPKEKRTYYAVSSADLVKMSGGYLTAALLVVVLPTSLTTCLL
jgi:hypothetical protein